MNDNKQFNNNVADYPTGVTLQQMISAAAGKYPLEVASVYKNDRLTYRDLEQRSNQLANYLIAEGVQPGTLVGLCCDRNIDVAVMILAILKTGAGYVPLDPDYPLDRVQFMAADAELAYVLGHEAHKELVRTLGPKFTLIEQVAKDINNCAKTDPEITVNAEQSIAYVIYTSGSTGRPKGCLVPHAPAVNQTFAMGDRLQFSHTDSLLATTTLAFDFSIMELFVPLFHGGTLVIADRQTAKDNDALVAAIEKHGVTFMQGTPAMWRLICQTDFAGGPHMTFVAGGEALPRDLLQPMLDRCGRLFNLYGPTETCVGSNMGQIKTANDRITVGPTFNNYNVYIVDDAGNVCPPETDGEVWIGGAGVTAGYQNRPKLTAEKFVTLAGERVYRSGDLGRMTEEGLLEIVGRIDNQVKIAGHRIELEEIDAAMANCENVKLAATVVQEVSAGDVRLIGYVMADDNTKVDLGSVRSTISKTLPEYMVPAVLTEIDEFPYTPSGKLDRNAFPAPSSERPDLPTAYVAAKTADEKALCQIFGEVLAINRVGVKDNFFEMGGNSIRAIKVVTMANEKMKLGLTAAEFYDAPSVEQLLSAKQDSEKFASPTSARRKPVEKRSDQFAIIGLAARLPGADSVDQFWANLLAGKESIRFFTPEEIDPLVPQAVREADNYVPARGIIEDADHFDARFFGITPREAEMVDPQQRIMLETAWTALEDAACVPDTFDGKIGIWAGTYATSYYSQILLRNPEAIARFGEFPTLVANEKDFIATRVAHRLNLTGPAINVNTACSTSLVAIIQACTALAAGHCDAAIAGGTSVQFPQNQGHLHQEGNIFTPDGHCRPFDANAAGTLFSDGAGAVVVKRLDDAIEQGDHIYAVIRGYGINNDGGSKASFSAPSIDGQAGAIAMALDHADVDAESIGYIEAHGTATLIGDPIEVSALQKVFGARTNKKQFCKIGSAKSNVGHTVAAAGVTGLIKTVLSLHHQQIPKTLHFENPNPQIDFANSPFSVTDKHTQWPRTETPRRAGVSAFGVGGTNAHIVLEEAPTRTCTAETTKPQGASRGCTTQDEVLRNEEANKPAASALPLSSADQPVQIFPVSAKTKTGLQSRMVQTAGVLSSGHQVHAIATTLQQGRAAQMYRGFVVAQTAKEAAEKFSNGKMPDVVTAKAANSGREIVFMFPGQGAQYVRMGQNLYQHNATFKTALDKCSDILTPLLGRDLRDVLFPEDGGEEASKEILKNTRFTQPALFALGYSLAQVWMDWGVTPDRLMGHSIGEFAAACIAGVFSLEDGLKMIAKRGELMAALPGGSMASVRKNGRAVQELLTGDLAVAAYNGPELCVVAGPDDQVAAFVKKLESQDIACRALHTSHAFHSSMMDSIVAPFEKFIGAIQLNPPQLPIVSTVTGKPMTDAEATSAKYWAEHLRRPVRFSDAVTAMWEEDDTRILIELGPRKTLATLAMQHAADRKKQTAIPSLSSHSKDNEEFKALLAAAGSLWLAGVDVPWARLTIKHGPKIPLPTYPFERKKFFVQPVNKMAHQLQPDIKANNQTQPLTPTPIPQQNQPTPTTVTKAKPMNNRQPKITEAIYEVFENTSGYDLTEFDADTTFFEMGLDSLVLTQTATALKKEFDVAITFRQLLEQVPTVESLAKFLDAEAPADKFASEAVAEAVIDTATPAPTSVVETAAPMNAAPMQQLAATPQPVQPAAMQPAAVAPVAMSGDANTQSVIQNQLQLMAAQLQLLGGAVPTAAASAAPAEPQGASRGCPTQDETSVKAAANEPAASAQSLSSAAPSDDAGEAKKKAFGAAARVTLSAETLSAAQEKALKDLIQLQCEAMPKSKAFAQQHRKYLADPRTVSGFRPDLKELVFPVVVDRTKGVNLWDLDGNKYIDFTCGFGSNFLGHVPDFVVDEITDQLKTDYSIGPQTPLAGEVAKLVHELTGNERTAFASTGSEAVMCCTRLARTYTGKDLVVYFSDDYHGILDEVIVRGNKKMKSFPAATGIPKSHVENALILPWADPKSLDIIRERIDELAGICLEPVQGRRPECQPKEFIQELRNITEDVDTALIFDEVITGFRIAPGGAQEYYGIRADLCSYGKVCGGGLPIGLISGKAKYMDGLDGGFWEFGDDSRPEAGMTYFAGTFLRHPPALRASKAILTYIKQQGQPLYDRMNALGDYATEQLNEMFQRMEVPMVAGNFGTLFKVKIKEELNYSELIFSGLRRRGMFMYDHRPNLMTTQHTNADVDAMVAAFEETLCELQPLGFVPGEGYKNAKPEFDANKPPKADAKIGKDRDGNKAWFVPDMSNPGQFTQVSQSNVM
jgi:amino acid adenylation domain-containing protein